MSRLEYRFHVGSTCTSCGERTAKVGDHCYPCLAEHFIAHPEELPEYCAEALEYGTFGEFDLRMIDDAIAIERAPVRQS